jgi:hypothetical protein
VCISYDISKIEICGKKNICRKGKKEGEDSQQNRSLRSLDKDALVHNAFAMKTQSSTDKFQHLNLRKKRGVKDAASEQNHGAMGQVIVGAS